MSYYSYNILGYRSIPGTDQPLRVAFCPSIKRVFEPSDFFHLMVTSYQLSGQPRTGRASVPLTRLPAAVMFSQRHSWFFSAWVASASRCSELQCPARAPPGARAVPDL